MIRKWVIWWCETEDYLHNMYDTWSEAKEVLGQFPPTVGYVVQVDLPRLPGLRRQQSAENEANSAPGSMVPKSNTGYSFDVV